jgi:hypothetical protein
MLFFASMTPKTGLRNLLRRLVLKGNDLLWVAFFQVGLAWAMTRLTACHLALPATYFEKLRMGSVGEGFELIFVAVFACFTADVTGVLRLCDKEARVIDAGFGPCGGSKPQNCAKDR